MNWLDDLRKRVDQLQQFATDYFEVVYKTILPFWKLPEIPSGANILTGSFATLLLYLARLQITQPLDTVVISGIVLTMVLFIVLLCGLAVVFDPKLAEPNTTEIPPPSGGIVKLRNFKKMVSVVCIGITLGYIFIVLDNLVSWINLIVDRAGSAASANRFIAISSAIGATLVLLANTLGQIGIRSFFSSARIPIWAAVVVIIIFVGIEISIGEAEPFWFQ